jgi:hypothetical protein
MDVLRIYNATSTHRYHTARLASEREELKMEDIKLLPRRTTSLVRRAMCSRVARLGTQASFDAEQKSRHQTHRRSHSARIPNIRHARARTLSTHPDSTSRGECSAMCGGSITFQRVTADPYTHTFISSNV